MDILEHKSSGKFVIDFILVKQHQSHLTTCAGCNLVKFHGEKRGENELKLILDADKINISSYDEEL